jgi:hypothetical protein
MVKYFREHSMSINFFLKDYRDGTLHLQFVRHLVCEHQGEFPDFETENSYSNCYLRLCAVVCL